MENVMSDKEYVYPVGVHTRYSDGTWDYQVWGKPKSSFIQNVIKNITILLEPNPEYLTGKGTKPKTPRPKPK